MSYTAKCQRCTGPGYASPEEAYRNALPESLLYVTCVQSKVTSPDYLATVDVDPKSASYSQVIHRTYMPHLGDELHHSGWNTCSSCYGDSSQVRDKLILPCLNSNRVYVLQVNGAKTSIHKVIEGHSLGQLNLSAPHTSHCLPKGQVMISCMGDSQGNNQGSFLLLDGKDFTPLANGWNQETVPFGYDFWYQPRLDVLVSSEWTAPKTFRSGFQSLNVHDKYGHSIHLWQLSSGKLIKSIDLRSTGQQASMPLEIRFLHQPDSCIGFVACAYTANVFRWRYDPQKKDCHLQQVIAIPQKKVDGFWLGEWLPALITDIVISMDDRFLFLSAWAFGEVRQYSVNINANNLPMIAVIRLGGLLSPVYSLKTIEDPEPIEQCHPKIKDTWLRGGCQMLQLSLDGRRLYVTNSLYSKWDQQFYPQMIEHGSQLAKIHVNFDNSTQTFNTSPSTRLSVDHDFLVDFGIEPTGPALAHEMRYPGGDCTSDIWI